MILMVNSVPLVAMVVQIDIVNYDVYNLAILIIVAMFM